MNKFIQMKNKLLQGWRNLSKNKKIAYSILTVVIIIALISFLVSALTPKYDVLFSNLSSTDSGAMLTQLKTDKVSYKVSGTSILVPKAQIDSVRMQLMSEVPLTDGSKGFELFDTSQMAPTDAQTKIMYQRALSGEIEKAIKSFPQVEGAKVNLVMPDSTAFVKDTDPATASVVVKLKPGNTLNNDQVKAIVALLTGAVQNLPKENVSVISDNFKLLTAGLYDKDKETLTNSTETQQALKAQVEKTLQDKITNLLEPVYKDGVKVSVNAELNFDALTRNSTTYATKGAVVSSHDVDTWNNGTSTGLSTSPVDSATQNTTATTKTNAKDGNVVSRDSTKNYDVSKTDDVLTRAPGAITKLTTSVVLDGNLDQATKTSVNNLVAQATGYSGKRGDTISVEGLYFNTDAKKAAQQALLDIANADKAAANKVLYTRIGCGVLAVIAFIILFVVIRRSSKKEEIEPEGFDTMIEDEIIPKKPEKHAPIVTSTKNKKAIQENEVKKYAAEKPEQVADIIKSWMTEDER
ncbi:flagellar basal-body MS-ring/collar protein FliF [Clostridium psychrophilum]|uniref:flagellar basal-body MS-ring/collar protein FliF n=1 Tax=Clostridium psychrophilum TaxID=132926 RepID=UPI001C0C490D|nr:flagellar basal-body MS-ring/collar protein FliF [Clostridium psychrophilum]MBU3180645.1 flagellar M-ring protein FliF [Clostridium psychrophilum]